MTVVLTVDLVKFCLFLLSIAFLGLCLAVSLFKDH